MRRSLRDLPRLTTAGVVLCAQLLTAASSSAQIQFTDVSASAGVDGDLYRSDTGHSLGVNWIDFNVDGWPDLFVVGGDPDRPPVLFENDGDGTFTRRSDLLGTLPAVEMSGSRFADYDRDGDPDLFIYTDNGQWSFGPNNLADGPANLLLHNRWVETGGALGPDEPLFEERAAAAGLQGLADPALGDLPGRRSKTAAWLDYDRDGCVDLFVGQLVLNAAGDPANRDQLFRNRCDGTFEDATASSGVNPGTDPNSDRAALASAGFHLDDDLWPELTVINVTMLQGGSLSHDFLYRHTPGRTGAAHFQDAAVGMPGIGDDAQAGMGVDAADVDLDGDWDLYISDIYATTLDATPLGNVFYAGDGDGGFHDNTADVLGIEAFDSWGVNFFDADADGWEDLYVSKISSAETEFFFRNDGADAGGSHAGFTNVAADAGIVAGNSRGSAVADYDRDGDLDFAVVNQNGPLQLFRNDTSSLGHVLLIELRGVQSSPDAIGTVIEARTGDVTRRRQVKGGSSAHSQDSTTVHFGLGSATRVDELRVRWPSGHEDTFSNVEVDRYLEVVEGRIFTDDFESGDLTAWSAVVPSSSR
ncbi:MAG: CRTAC1 family protein [Acidobacteriota bacterium]